MNKKKKMVQTVEEVGQYLSKLENDKKVMLEKIGSPRVQRRLLDSQSSLEYDDLEEDSNESVRVRQARNQLRNLSKQINSSYDPQEAEVKKKKAAAKKLMLEKEKAIEEGLKDRLKSFESHQVDSMLNLALKIDVN